MCCLRYDIRENRGPASRLYWLTGDFEEPMHFSQWVGNVESQCCGLAATRVQNPKSATRVQNPRTVTSVQLRYSSTRSCREFFPPTYKLNKLITKQVKVEFELSTRSSEPL